MSTEDSRQMAMFNHEWEATRDQTAPRSREWIRNVFKHVKLTKVRCYKPKRQRRRSPNRVLWL